MTAVGAVARPVILDTDPGIDDAVALMLAAVSPEIELLGITTVAGNVGVEVTTRNALALCQLLGLQCPVGKGAWRSLAAHGSRDAAHIHGADGLGGWRIADPPATAQTEAALGLLSRLLRSAAAAGQRATIVAVGPLTNIAQLLVADAAASDLIAEIVVMGGGDGERLGNVTPRAEFNIYTDPEAAAIVFNSGVPVTMVGLNVTELATLGAVHLPQLLAHGGPVAEGVQVMLGAYKDTPEEAGLTAQHDSLALTAVLRPELLTLRPAQVRVHVTPGERRGETEVSYVAGVEAAGAAGAASAEAADTAAAAAGAGTGAGSAAGAGAAAGVGAAGQPARVRVATAVDVPRFREFMAERLFAAAQRAARI